MKSACCKGLDAILAPTRWRSIPPWAYVWYQALQQVIYDARIPPAGAIGRQSALSPAQAAQVGTDLQALKSLVEAYDFRIQIRAAIAAYDAYRSQQFGSAQLMRLRTAITQLNDAVMAFIWQHPSKPAIPKTRNVLGTAIDTGKKIAEGAAKQYLVLHIDDPKGLVAHEKGSGVAWLATSFMPEYVENTIYGTVKQQLQDQFKERGSTVSVDIVQSPPEGEKPTSDLKGGVVLGVILSALGYGVAKFVGAMRRK